MRWFTWLPFVLKISEHSCFIHDWDRDQKDGSAPILATLDSKQYHCVNIVYVHRKSTDLSHTWSGEKYQDKNNFLKKWINKSIPVTDSNTKLLAGNHPAFKGCCFIHTPWSGSLLSSLYVQWKAYAFPSCMQQFNILICVLPFFRKINFYETT